MAEVDSATQVLGMVATVTTIGQFLSGIPTVLTVVKNRSAGNISPLPFLLGTVGCSLWLAYGKVLDEPMIIFCNVVGVILNALYVLIFLQFVEAKTEFLKQIGAAGAFLTSVVWVAIQPDNVRQSAENLGLVCSLVTIVCCASPLLGLKQIIKTKSTESLPFPLILSTFFVCVLWLLFGIRTGDKYTLITNAAGTAISIFQLSLFAVYPSTKSSKVDKNRNKKMQ